jgi:hypothetical protein
LADGPRGEGASRIPRIAPVQQVEPRDERAGSGFQIDVPADRGKQIAGVNALAGELTNLKPVAARYRVACEAADVAAGDAIRRIEESLIGRAVSTRAADSTKLLDRAGVASRCCATAASIAPGVPMAVAPQINAAAKRRRAAIRTSKRVFIVVPHCQ